LRWSTPWIRTTTILQPDSELLYPMDEHFYITDAVVRCCGQPARPSASRHASHAMKCAPQRSSKQSAYASEGALQ
jgi:hypothetical protein